MPAPEMSDASCAHAAFQQAVLVRRLEPSAHEAVLRVEVRLQVRCRDCQAPVLFALPPTLIVPGAGVFPPASMSGDGLEARLGGMLGGGGLAPVVQWGEVPGSEEPEPSAPAEGAGEAQ